MPSCRVPKCALDVLVAPLSCQQVRGWVTVADASSRPEEIC